MPERYRVRVEKERFVFSAAHFITFGDNICERLHGHNYRVAAEVGGALEKHHYVVDFILLRDALVELTQALDHRVLLPTIHPTIKVGATGGEVVVSFEDRRWVFPKEDCVLLPVENTTAELLARHLGRQLIEKLRSQTDATIESVTVCVDECDGQEGVWQWGEDS